jgi:hypothetical protein
MIISSEGYIWMKISSLKNLPNCWPVLAFAFSLQLILCAGLTAQQGLPSTEIAPQLKESSDGLSLWWTGNAGWLMQYGESWEWI